MSTQTESRPTSQEIHQEAEASHRKLEETRVESRKARQALIDTIMCDERDVLCESDIAEIQAKLATFLEVQNRLGRAFFDNANADAMFLWDVGKDMDRDIEPD